MGNFLKKKVETIMTGFALQSFGGKHSPIEPMKLLAWSLLCGSSLPSTEIRITYVLYKRMHGFVFIGI